MTSQHQDDELRGCTGDMLGMLLATVLVALVLLLVAASLVAIR